MKKWLLFGAAALAAMTIAACGSSTNSGGGSAKVESGDKAFTVKASNFEFDITEIRVKQGDKVKITFVNAAGVHGIGIPDLNIDIKDNNGVVEFTADKVGEFEYICNIMCGAGHADMVGKIIVEA